MAHDSRLIEQTTNIKFVYEVKKRPCLYNPDLMSFSRKDITEQAWHDIGKVMNLSGGACKEKWRHIRIVYMRHMKSSRFSGTGRRKRRYYLSEAMQFLLPFMKIAPQALKKTKSDDEQEKEKTFYDAYRFKKDNNDQPEEVTPEAWKVPEVKTEPDDDISNDTSTYQDPEGISLKEISVQDQEHYNILKETERGDHSSQCYVLSSNDPVRSFLNSLVPELTEMNGTQFKSFKRRVLALIDDITDNSETGTTNYVENVTDADTLDIKY